MLVAALSLSTLFLVSPEGHAATDIYSFSSQVTSTSSTIAPNYYVTDVSVGVEQDLDTLDIAVDFAQPISASSFAYQQVGGIAGVVTPTLSLSIASSNGSPVYGLSGGSINMGTGASGIWLGQGLFAPASTAQKLNSCAVSSYFSQAFNKTLYFSFSRKCVQLPSQFIVQTQMNFYSLSTGANQYSLNNPYTPFLVDLTKVPGFKQSQSITAQNPGNPYLNQGSIQIVARDDHNLPMTYTAQGSAGVCSVPDLNSPNVALLGQGSCTIVISAAGNTAFDPAVSVQVAFQVLPPQVDQSITHNLPPSISLDNPQVSFQATDSSGSQVVATSNNSNICQVIGSSTVQAFNTGTCSITLTAPSNGNFKAATMQVNIQVTPQKVAQEVYYTAPSDVHVGDASFDVPLSDNSGLDISVISDTPNVCQFNDPTDPLLVTIAGAGTCSMEVNQDGSDQYLPFSANGVTFEVLPLVKPQAGTSTTPKKGGPTTPTKAAPPKKIVIKSFTNSSSTQQKATSQTSNPNVASGSATSPVKSKSSTPSATKSAAPKVTIKVTTPKKPAPKKTPVKKK